MGDLSLGARAVDFFKHGQSWFQQPMPSAKSLGKYVGLSLSPLTSRQHQAYLAYLQLSRKTPARIQSLLDTFVGLDIAISTDSKEGLKAKMKKLDLKRDLEDKSVHIRMIGKSVDKDSREKMKDLVYSFQDVASRLTDHEERLGIVRDYHDFGRTAWHLACKYGKTETAQVIIKNSKNFDIDLNAKDEHGDTALHKAIYNGETETVQLIIKNSKEFGIDLNAKSNNGNTALHVACRDGQTETAQLFIKNSKDCDIALNAKNDDGDTALHRACFNSRTETVQMILKNWKEFGIDIKAQTNYGTTALDFIRYRQGEIWNQIKKMLEKEYSQIDVTEPVFCD